MIHTKIIEFFINHNCDGIGLAGKVDYSIEAVYERQLSCVIKVKYFTDSVIKTVFIKVSADHEFIMWGGCLQKEFEILKLIKADKILGNSVPKVVLFSPKNDALVTEAVDGDDATMLLNKSLTFSNSIMPSTNVIQITENSGTWLSEFHNLTGIKAGVFDFEPAIRWVDARLKLLIKYNARGVDEDFRNKIIEKLISLKSEIDKQRVMLSGNHSDFCPHNILVREDNSIVVIDFSSYIEGPVEYDILRFYNELDNMGYQFSCSARKAKILKEKFLASYGYSINLSSPLTQFILCQYKVAKLLSSLKAGCGCISFWNNGRVPYNKNLAWIKEFSNSNVSA